MTKRTITGLVAIALALPLAFASMGAVSAQSEGECLSGHEIQSAIASGQIMPLNQAMSAAGINGRPLGSPTVCIRNGVPEYRVNIIDDYGGSDAQVLNAQGG